MVSACSGTNCVDTTITEPIESAKEELKQPEVFYLVDCLIPPESKSDELPDILELIRTALIDGSECFNRHNSLSDQFPAVE